MNKSISVNELKNINEKNDKFILPIILFLIKQVMKEVSQFFFLVIILCNFTFFSSITKKDKILPLSNQNHS